MLRMTGYQEANDVRLYSDRRCIRESGETKVVIVSLESSFVFLNR